MNENEKFEVTLKDVEDYVAKVYHPYLSWSGHYTTEGNKLKNVQLDQNIDLYMYDIEADCYRSIGMKFQLEGISDESYYKHENERLSQIWREVLLKNHGLKYAEALLIYAGEKILDEKKSFKIFESEVKKLLSKTIELRRKEMNEQCMKYQEMAAIANDMIGVKTKSSNNNNKKRK